MLSSINNHNNAGIHSLTKGLAYIFLWCGFIFIFYLSFSMHLIITDSFDDCIRQLTSTLPSLVGSYAIYFVVNHFLCAKVISKRAIITVEVLLALNILCQIVFEVSIQYHLHG